MTPTPTTESQHGSIQRKIRFFRSMVFGVVAAVGLLILGLLVIVPVDERIVAPGVVRAERDTILYSPREGILHSIEQFEGDEVAQGTPLLRLDDSLLRNELKQIDARIEKAVSELELQKARFERTSRLPLPSEFWHIQEEAVAAAEKQRQAAVELERANDLHSRGLASRQELEHAELSLRLAETEAAKATEKSRILEQGLEDSIVAESLAEIHRSQSEIRSLEVERAICLEEIERRVIRAPEDGTVTYLYKRRPGTRVEAGDELLRLAHGKALRVELFAGENQYHRIRPGQRVIMRSQSFEPLRHGYLEGIVSRVSFEPEHLSQQESTNNPSSTSSLPVYRVIASLDSPTTIEIPLGSTVHARIILQRVPLWKVFLPESFRNE